MTSDSDRPSKPGRSIAPSPKEERRALQTPKGVAPERGLVSHIVETTTNRWKTNGATRLQESENAFVRAQVNHGEALEDLYRQADRVKNIERIIEDDRTVFDTAAATHEDQYNAAMHNITEADKERKENADISADKRQTDALQAKMDLIRKRQELEALQNPTPEPDRSARKKELTAQIAELSAKLGDETLTEDLRDYLTGQRRALNDELDILMAGNGR